jgi:hypothetical protein
MSNIKNETEIGTRLSQSKAITAVQNRKGAILVTLEDGFTFYARKSTYYRFAFVDILSKGEYVSNCDLPWFTCRKKASTRTHKLTTYSVPVTQEVL